MCVLSCLNKKKGNQKVNCKQNCTFLWHKRHTRDIQETHRRHTGDNFISLSFLFVVLSCPIFNDIPPQDTPSFWGLCFYSLHFLSVLFISTVVDVKFERLLSQTVCTPFSFSYCIECLQFVGQFSRCPSLWIHSLYCYSILQLSFTCVVERISLSVCMWLMDMACYSLLLTLMPWMDFCLIPSDTGLVCIILFIPSFRSIHSSLWWSWLSWSHAHRALRRNGSKMCTINTHSFS